MTLRKPASISTRARRVAGRADRQRRRIVLSIYDDQDNPFYAGGGPVVVARVAAALQPRYEVIILTAGRRWRIRRDGDVCKVYLPLAWAGPRCGQILWGLLLPIIAMVTRYDLWIETFTPPMSSNFVPLVTRRPVVGLAQALSGRSIADRYRTSLPLRLERLLLRAYRDVIVLNERDAVEVRRWNAAARIHLIRNSVDLPSQPPVIPDHGEYILYLGRIDIREKGLDLLLEAYGKLGADRLPLRIAGSGIPSQQAALERLLGNVPGDVLWLGKVSGQAKDDLLEHAALVVVPSREESFSLVALEALVRGRPVVHFDLPQLDWIPEDCGLRVPCFDTGALAAALQRLTEDVELRCAKEFCAQHYGAGCAHVFDSSYQLLVERLLASVESETSAPTVCGLLLAVVSSLIRYLSGFR